MNLLLALLITATTYGQKDSLPPRPDSTFIVMDDFLKFIYDKVSAKDYDLTKRAAADYIRQKEFLKPKKK